MGDTPFSTVRVAARLANGFALDLVKLGGFGRDVIDGLLLMAITQANTAHIVRSAELQRAYATISQVPPDADRRPVSVNAVANSLRVPFETARRRIAALVELGIVQATPKGLIVPQAPLNSPFYRMAAEANYHLVRTLYMRLRAIGLLANLAPAAPYPIDPADVPSRLVIRHSGDYVLRLAEPLRKHIGDLITAIVLMDVIHANTEHLPDHERGVDDASAEGFVPDSRRRPVRAQTISERLGVPAETVRRHLDRLIADGRCARTSDGYLVPAEVLARPGFVAFMLHNQTQLQRMFAALAEFGVTAAWDREREGGLRGAA